MITLHAEDTCLAVSSGLDDTQLVSGMANVPKVTFTFSESWLGFAKAAVFSNGTTVIQVPLETDGDEIPIPHEVLAQPRMMLYIGLQGTKMGEDGIPVVMPTPWCRIKTILAGADPDGDHTTIPSKPHWKDVKDTLEELVADATEEADRAAAEADRAEQGAATAGYMFFELDDRGHVLYTRTPNTQVDFDIVNGRLVVYA